jgi:hypothetical protein
MKRYRLDPKKPAQLAASDLKRLDRMTDADIDYSDIPELDEAFFKSAAQIEPPAKKNTKDN